MTAERPPENSAWVYESIVRTIPGIDVPNSVAVIAQLLGFQVAVVALAWYHGLPRAAVVASVGVVVAVAGSAFMLRLSRVIRRGDPPAGYRELLFDSGIEVVLGLVAFILLIVYLFVYDPARSEEPLVTALLGEQPPLTFTFVLLLIAWDVVYRIGVGWWASVVGLWRSIGYAPDLETRNRFRRADLLTIGFAASQLLLVPVLTGHPLLQLAIVGHVIAVALVSGTSVALLTRDARRTRAT